MATPEKSCVICGGTEAEGEVLVMAPCRRHWVCPDDIADFFQRATDNESLYPPKCCDQVFMIDEYDDHVPFEISWPFRIKQSGDYAVLARYRVYCSSPQCSKFLNPETHITDPDTGIVYAICQDGDCGTKTCVGCKKLLVGGKLQHECSQADDEKEFKKTADEKGYQQCGVCGTTVELAEACNHITCDCGHSFCYICGEQWPGLHGCPHYGVPIYDEEDYNQDGYHRTTVRNREGLTRRQEERRRHGENPDDEDDGEINEEDDVDFEILQHLDTETREALMALSEDDRERQLDVLQIHLFETQGILFNHVAPPPPHGPGQAPHHPGWPADELDGEDDGEEDDENAGEGAEIDDDLDGDDDPDDDGTFDEDDLASDRYADDQSEDEDEVEVAAPPTTEPTEPTQATQDNHSISGASLATNSSYVGSDAHERLAHDFPGPFVNEPDAEVLVPATPTAREAAREAEVVAGVLEQINRSPPGAWVEELD